MNINTSPNKTAKASNRKTTCSLSLVDGDLLLVFLRMLPKPRRSLHFSVLLQSPKLRKWFSLSCGSLKHLTFLYNLRGSTRDLLFAADKCKTSVTPKSRPAGSYSFFDMLRDVSLRESWNREKMTERSSRSVHGRSKFTVAEIPSVNKLWIQVCTLKLTSSYVSGRAKDLLTSRTESGSFVPWATHKTHCSRNKGTILNKIHYRLVVSSSSCFNPSAKVSISWACVLECQWNFTGKNNALIRMSMTVFHESWHGIICPCRAKKSEGRL